MEREHNTDVSIGIFSAKKLKEETLQPRKPFHNWSNKKLISSK